MIDSAAERGMLPVVYLAGSRDASRWYPRAPSAFTSILPWRETHRQRCISVVSAML
jgi:hypothetical protein